jgi:hypothetical protein
MRIGLRIAAGVLLGITLVVWLATGAHTGWTKTRVTTMRIDPITELEYPEIEKKFVAGVDVLGAGTLPALALFGCSYLFKSQPTKKRKDHKP